MTSYRESLTNQLDAITRALASLDAQPKEPEGYEPAILHWQMRYGNNAAEMTAFGGRPRFGTGSRDGKVYSFAAIRVEDGRWYPTGGATGCMTWEQLMRFLLEENEVIDGIWIADGFTRIDA